MAGRLERPGEATYERIDTEADTEIEGRDHGTAEVDTDAEISRSTIIYHKYHITNVALAESPTGRTPKQSEKDRGIRGQ